MDTLNWPNLVSGLLGGVLSSSAIVLGMSRWFGDIWAGRILAKQKAKYEEDLEALRSKYARELETLKAKLDRSVYMTRAQFETEFDAYKQVFQALSQVRLHMAGMRPMLSVEPERELKEERLGRLNKRLLPLIEAQDKAVAIVENLLPFYPAEIYSELVDRCLKASALEILDIRTAGHEPFSFPWFEQGRKRMDDFMSSYDSVSQMIRERIRILAIVPRS